MYPRIRCSYRRMFSASCFEFRFTSAVRSTHSATRGCSNGTENCCSVMIYHRGASLSEQHNDLLCTKQDLSHTSRYVDESLPDSQVSHMYARTATLSVTTYAKTKLYTKFMT